MANNSVDYGFKYNATRDGYKVDEGTIPTVCRIFRMVGLEGYSLRKIKQRFEAEGLLTPGGKRYWSETFIREVVKDDVYRPHSFEEIKALVTPEVAAQLDPDKSYGIWWFNRQRHTCKQTAENSSEGKVYRKQKKAVDKPQNEWIAVPVPDAGIPREVVDAGRGIIKNNRRASSAGRRFWELSGGILYCSGCGRQMVQHSSTSGWSQDGKRHFYYRCRQRWRHGRDACKNHKMLRADGVEALVWGMISALLQDPDKLRADLDRMIELERNSMRSNPVGEQKWWLDKLAEADRKRARYQEMAADDLISFDELRARLAELDETRSVAERELNALRSQKERIGELEADRDSLLDSLTGMVPNALVSLAPEERHHVYKMLKLKVIVSPDGTLEVSGVFGDGFAMCNLETGSGSRSGPSSSGTSSASTSAST